MNEIITLPLIIAEKLGQEKPTFVLFSKRIAKKRDLIKSILFSGPCLVLLVHVCCALLFKKHHLIIRSYSDILIFGDIIKLNAEKIIPTIPVLILSIICFIIIGKSFKELISPSQTYWIGTSRYLFVMRNSTIKLIQWEDFFGKINCTLTENQISVDLYFLSSKADYKTKLYKRNYSTLSIFEATYTPDAENNIRNHILANSIDK